MYETEINIPDDFWLHWRAFNRMGFLNKISAQTNDLTHASQ